jgi:Bacterial protein of unknown function (DUF839)
VTARTALRVTVSAATVAAMALATGTALATTSTGPSTTTAPYVLPVASGVDITSLFTVGDGAADNGFRMVGIPDGLGTYLDGAGNRVLLMNQEIGSAGTPAAPLGTTRAHGQKGAFVSKLTLDSAGRVVSGEDFITSVTYFRYADGSYGSAPDDGTPAYFLRFCSGALTAPGQLLVGPGKDGNGEGQGRGNGKYGYAGQIYFANEENGAEGRAFGVTLDGHATQLPALGKLSWENTLAAANDTRTTLVMGDDDGATDASFLRIYHGTKTREGSAVERAGLTNGVLSVLKVAGATKDSTFRTVYGAHNPQPFTLAHVDAFQTGAAQAAAATAVGGLGFTRIEDGAFNPENKNEYFFLTTEGGDKTAASTGSRDGGGLWKLTYADVEHPELGGTLELLLDGSESWGTGESRVNKPDNMTIDEAGNLLIQEDPGGNDHLSRILAYRLADGARGVVARFDPALFGVTNPAGSSPATRAVLTTDEESSGIVTLPDGSYLFDAQVHTAKGLPTGTGPGTVEELVERGQLLRMTVDDFGSVYTVTP